MSIETLTRGMTGGGYRLHRAGCGGVMYWARLLGATVGMVGMESADGAWGRREKECGREILRSGSARPGLSAFRVGMDWGCVICTYLGLIALIAMGGLTFTFPNHSHWYKNGHTVVLITHRLQILLSVPPALPTSNFPLAMVYQVLLARLNQLKKMGISKRPKSESAALGGAASRPRQV